MDLINDYEARFPVEQWAIRGVRVWPIIRIALARELQLAGTPERVRDFSETSAAEARAALRGLVKHFRAQAVDFRHNQWPVGHRGAVFLTNAHFRVALNGQWFDQVCDPIIEVLGRKGVGSFVLERNLRWDYRIPRHSGSMFVLPRLRLMRLQTKLFRPRLASEQARLPGFDQFVSELARGGYGIHLPSRENLEILVDALLRSAAYFRRLLRRLGAFIGFTAAYYGLDGMAFNLACRQVGIPSVDLQHGLQGPLHVAYGRWLKVPDRSYELLPFFFWTWSDREAEIIDAWSRRVPQGHKPVVCGNPWLDMWLDGGSELVRHYGDMLGRIKAEHPAQRHILVALGPFREMLAPWIVETIRQSSPQWFWWLRLHPQWRTLSWARKLLLEHFKDDRPENIEIDRATDYPLPALLRMADLVVTNYSSVVLEAEKMGVPSVVTSEYGSELYVRQIESGWTSVAFSSQELRRAIEAEPRVRKDLGGTLRSRGLGRRRQSGLEALLKAAGRGYPGGGGPGEIKGLRG